MLKLDKNIGNSYLSMFDIFLAWNDVSKKFACGEIYKDEYDRWRYSYPKPLSDNKNVLTKVVSVPLDFDFREEV